MTVPAATVKLSLALSVTTRPPRSTLALVVLKISNHSPAVSVTLPAPLGVVHDFADDEVAGRKRRAGGHVAAGVGVAGRVFAQRVGHVLAGLGGVIAEVVRARIPIVASDPRAARAAINACVGLLECDVSERVGAAARV